MVRVDIVARLCAHTQGVAADGIQILWAVPALAAPAPVLPSPRNPAKHQCPERTRAHASKEQAYEKILTREAIENKLLKR